MSDSLTQRYTIPKEVININYLGLDLHKTTCYGTLLDEEGEELLSKEFENTREGWSELIQQIPEEAKVALEASGSWYPVVDRLEEEGFEVVLSHPKKTRAIAEAKVKTDKVDSEILAKLLRSGFLPEAWIPPKKVRRDREVVRSRIQLGRDLTELKNRIHSLVKKNGLTHEFTDLFGRKGKEWLREVDLPEHERTVLDSQLKILEEYQEQLDSLEAEIADLARKDPEVRRLMTVPGINYYSGLLIRSEIGEIERFPGHKELASYAGLAPSVRNSGEKTRHGSISKDGNSRLRWILVQCIQHTVRYESDLKEFYQRLKGRKGTKVAKVAAARKLLRIIWCMLSREEDYRDEIPEMTQKKLYRMGRKAKQAKN